ncbi:MAG TPA: hypothetical protein VNJ01_07930 [Bacteriovoracaceae bacterium]|nr:hypothetical protein [Bacteriovoracaceae bacterium]
MTDKQIQDWHDKIRSSFGDEARLYQYLFETMDNFYYRYLETTSDKDLRTRQMSDHVWGATSTETSMVDALRIQNELARKGIIELAKSVQRAQGPKVVYQLSCRVSELHPDSGSLEFTASINWGHPDDSDPSRRSVKTVKFDYRDLGQFRKELAVKLEDVCGIFL